MQPTFVQPIEEYRSRLAKWQAEQKRLALKYQRLGNARLTSGLALAAVAAITFGPGWISAWWLLVPLVPLVILIVIFPSVDRALSRAVRSVAYYEHAVARLEHRWAGSGRPGDALRPADHLFADDLDLFGRGSLFELLSVARTSTGERTLADWLLTPGEHSAVLARQIAVQELRDKIDLRQDIALTGEDIRVALDDRRLAAWGASPAIPFFPGARILALVLAIAAVVTFATWQADYTPLYPFLLVALAELFFFVAVRNPIQKVIDGVNTPANELQLVALILARLEAEPFTSPELVRLQDSLRVNGKAATKLIGRLQRLTEWMEWAHNQVFAIVGAALLWVPQFAMAIEAWRQECGPHIAEWIAAVGEFEALSSLSGFAYERPTAIFPELLPGSAPIFDAHGIVHPLISPAEAVANDVSLNSATPLWIISGSNMSGKSTLLRAVGVNAALAWAGAPVTVASLRLSRLKVGASLRTHDSLADNRSRFYAEISRLKQIVDVASCGEPLLFLVDELLSGTNSHDRRIGAEALLTGLIKRGAIGLATTHDLALTEMATSLDGKARNVHLEDYLEAGQIRFDYKLRPGVIERGNALELMRAVGLDV